MYPVHSLPMPNDTSSKPNPQSILALEDMIKGYLADIAAVREKLKAHREMLKSTMEQDKDYSEVSEKHQTIKKEVAKVKETIVKNPSVIATKVKVNDLGKELREAQLALSDYLNQYAQITQSSEFVGPDGEVMQIVRSAKLVKRRD